MRRHIYTLLNEQETKELEDTIKKSGFKTRTDYFTACAMATIYGEDLAEWIKKIRALSKEKKQQHQIFFTILEEMGLAVVAMRGCETATKALSGDLQREFFLRTNLALSKEQIKRLIEAYAMIHTDKLQRYRSEVHADAFRSAL